MLLSEMFGVERDTGFGVKGYESLFKITLNSWGKEHLMFKLPRLSAWETASQGTLCSVIFAAPTGIIHLPPPLTDEQREQLKAIWTLGGRWIVEDETGDVFAYGSKPQKIMICGEWHDDKEVECFTVMRGLSVCAIVSWSDPEPYDIGKALGVNLHTS